MIQQKTIAQVNWKIVLPLGIVFILFSALVFPHYQNKVNTIAGEEVEFLDTRHHYDFETVKDCFEKMGAEGRAIYTAMTSKADMIYPLLYGSFFILLLFVLLKGILPPKSKWLFLALFPLSIMVLDYLENANILLLLEHFPENLTQANVEYGSMLTSNKHRCVGATFLAIGILGSLNVVKRLNSVSKINGLIFYPMLYVFYS